MDRLLPAREAAKTIGLSVDDLALLRRAGQIAGTIQRVRSKKGRPRYWYAESELKRYMASLETSTGVAQVVVPKPPRRRPLLKVIRNYC